MNLGSWCWGRQHEGSLCFRVGKAAMKFEESVANQIALLNAGRILEALDRYFAEDGIMWDNDELFAEGLAESRSKQERLINNARAIHGKITRCVVNSSARTCAFRNQSSFVDGSGQYNEIDGLHLQRWQGGKIVEERYYRGELAARKLTEGMLEDGIRLEP